MTESRNTNKRFSDKASSGDMADNQKHCIVMPSYGHSAFFKNCLLVSIFSIRKFAEDIPIIVMYSGLTASQRQILSDLDCQLLEVDPSPFSVAHRPTLTEATYFKFYIQELQGFDKVLWLDSDTLIINSLLPLFESTDQIGTRLRRRPLSKEFKDPEYVISDLSLPADLPIIQGGVICISPEFMREENFFEQALYLLERYGHDFFLNVDQGILSILFSCCQNVADFPVSWNFCRYYDMKEIDLGIQDNDLSGIRRATHDNERIRVIHWNGARKPHEMDVAADGGLNKKETLFYSLWREISNECFIELGIR